MRAIDADALFDEVFRVWGTEIDAGIANEFMALINAAPTIAPPPNDPLTPEELRRMGGEPYWHVGLQEDSPAAHWAILQYHVARCPQDYSYGKNWLAYRRRLERVADGSQEKPRVVTPPENG